MGLKELVAGCKNHFLGGKINMSEPAILIRNQNENSWETIQDKLKNEYGEATYKSWLSKLHLSSYNKNEVTLSTPTKFMRDWIISHYKDGIERLWQTLDPNVVSVNIILDSLTDNEAPPHTEPQTKPIPTKAKELALASEEYDFISCLDGRFTFENFVVGNPNELAYAAARSVAESSKVKPGSNPLFLYGGVGLGKTHLMHAIAWHIYNNDKNRKVIYMSAEKFMYQFIAALRNKDVMSFKENFRSVDVLMIDDVQFICGKDSTQEEFFHTFNALIDNNRQVVISCDRSPSDLDNMEERIKSRLGWGLVADVHSTTYELRLGILQSKLEQMQTEFPQEVLEFLAAKVTSNVRELEGALNKVVAHSRLIGKKITLHSTQEILRDLLRSNEKLITIDDIQKIVSEHFNVKFTDMASARRVRSIVRPRQIAMYLAKGMTSKSLAEIGKKFGGKDHTTVMHAIKTIEGLMATEIELKEDVKLLTRILES